MPDPKQGLHPCERLRTPLPPPLASPKESEPRPNRAGGACSNVVALPAVNRDRTEAIMAAAEAKWQQQEEFLSERLRELGALFDNRHRRRVSEELVPIALAMDAQSLMDFIEIGRQMAARRPRAAR